MKNNTNQTASPQVESQKGDGSEASPVLRATPAPYDALDLNGCFDLVRAWEAGKVEPGEERTFGSAAGAHVARVEYCHGGLASKEQAQINAEFICRAVNSHQALVEKLEQLTILYGVTLKLKGVTEEDASYRPVAQAVQLLKSLSSSRGEG